ncbi:MAG: hypothetical protein JNK21_02945 [Rhodospirillaceae bacterium]|nr:hypothetical protein [Rhodospirillaceae bacterium]
MSAASLSKIKSPVTPPWLITFVDLVMLLLSFFVLMFAMAQPDAARYAAIAQSAAAALKPGAVGNDKFVSSRTYVREDDDNLDDMSYLAAALKAASAQSADLKALQFRSTERAVMVSLPGVLAPDSVRVAPEAMPAVFDLAGVLANIGNPIAVVGSAEGSSESWSKGLMQANVVAAALKKAGYDRPIASLARMPTTEKAQNATNEPIEIMIMADPQQQTAKPQMERMP